VLEVFSAFDGLFFLTKVVPFLMPPPSEGLVEAILSVPELLARLPRPDAHRRLTRVLRSLDHARSAALPSPFRWRKVLK
jgi:hypothetical protein